MLEATRLAVPQLPRPEEAAMCLVRLPADPNSLCRSWTIRPPTQVLFGRAPAAEPGVLDALADTAPDDTLSRRHARLVYEPDYPQIIDLGSTNGTWLDGRRLLPHSPTFLWSGAMFRVGASHFAWLGAVGGRHDGGRRRPEWLGEDAFFAACLGMLMQAESGSARLALVVMSLDCESNYDPEATVQILENRVTRAWPRVLTRDIVLGRLAPNEWAILVPEISGEMAKSFVSDLHLLFLYIGSTEVGAPVVRLRTGLAMVSKNAGPRSIRWIGYGQTLIPDAVKRFIDEARSARDSAPR